MTRGAATRLLSDPARHELHGNHVLRHKVNVLSELEVFEQIADHFRLGPLIDAPTPVSGGLMNDMWRVSTESGDFAVKILATTGIASSFRRNEAFRLEKAALEAGLRLPKPVPDPTTGLAVAEIDVAYCTVHEWVDADHVAPVPMSNDDAFDIGRFVATVHRIDLDVAQASGHARFPRSSDWDEAIAGVASLDSPTADLIADSRDALVNAEDFFNQYASAKTVEVFTHGDIHQRNLLRDENGLIVIDWEVSNHRAIVHELASTVFSITNAPAMGPRFETTAAFFDGYLSTDAVIPTVGPEWLLSCVSNVTHFLLFDLNRAIASDENRERKFAAVPNLVRDIRFYTERQDELVDVLASAVGAVS